VHTWTVFLNPVTYILYSILEKFRLTGNFCKITYQVLIHNLLIYFNEVPSFKSIHNYYVYIRTYVHMYVCMLNLKLSSVYNKVRKQEIIILA